MFLKVSACFVIIPRRSGIANGVFERRGHAPERARRRHYHVPSMLFLTCFGEGRDARGMLIIDSYGFGEGGKGALTGGSAVMPHLVSWTYHSISVLWYVQPRLGSARVRVSQSSN